MSLPGREAALRRVQRAARRNEYVAETVWWSVFVCYAIAVGAVGLGGVVGGVYVYLRYVFPMVAEAVGLEAQVVIGLGYVFVLFCALHSVVSRIRRWVYGDATDARWKR
ncbi:hypothetical protein Hbl1158_07940 [Halobaculum sp. CBA1158]|uniref:hypothetical protein n=1 Tax=Halobaculum sp. CBA1158 TaxID=2904243 RepID=UPI001F21DFCD|nr:hypothetical protein [Halobaculum sp. CBA1158]UIO98496.1 hypothetical protein Hbl1158_07940 [Halobaculum sp. CBA1158]